jgi:TolB protein
MRFDFSRLCMTALCISIAASGAALSAQDAPGVRLGIQNRPGQKPSLLVLPIRGAFGDSIAAMVSRDLDYSDRFTLVPTSTAAEPAGPPNYAVFAKLGVDGIVQATLLPSGWLRVALLDVFKKTVANQKDFPLPTQTGTPSWRMAVHGVSDGIEEWVTSQRGIAQTQIAFERDKKIWLVDSDGANARPVTPAGMSPSWAPSGRALVYSVNTGRDPLFVTELATGAQRTLTQPTAAQDLTPSVSPDGRTVAFARVADNGTDLFTMPFSGGSPTRITVGRGSISSQPTFSPDGQRIVFSSDRSGHNEVYICDLDGTNVEALTDGVYGDRNYRTGPDWSPDGRLVAFESLNGGVFQIMTVNLRDKSVRTVTNDGRNGDPSWAPDSRHLVFTSNRSGVRQLWVVDVESGRTRQLTRGSSARLSAWSPRLATP